MLACPRRNYLDAGLRLIVMGGFCQMENDKRQAVLAKIKSSIGSQGYHVRIVTGGPFPRFAYTIGLYPRLGFELVFAGGLFFTLDETLEVTNEIARMGQAGGKLENETVRVEGKGGFSFREVDSSWSSKLLLGALDYFSLKQIRTLQFVPDYDHWTIDVPDMQEPWNPAVQPMWRWLEANWNYPVSSKSTAITNLDALRGHRVTEVVRGEEDEWELFAGAGPNVEKTDIRRVPLGAMIALDETLKSVIDLKIGAGLWRDENDGEWQVWGKEA